MATPITISASSAPSAPINPTNPSFTAHLIETQHKIAAIHLGHVEDFLKNHEGWGDIRIAETERLYRKFLQVLAAMDPAVTPVAPTEDLRSFWFAHCNRDRGGYYNMCLRIVGRYVRPRRFFPFGARAGKEATRLAWLALFGEEPPKDHLALI